MKKPTPDQLARLEALREVFRANRTAANWDATEVYAKEIGFAPPKSPFRGSRTTTRLTREMRAVDYRRR